jgi:RNA polymerase primary sigma factor
VDSEKVTRAVDALIDASVRQGGELSDLDFDRVAARSGLGAEERAAALEALEGAGVTFRHEEITGHGPEASLQAAAQEPAASDPLTLFMNDIGQYPLLSRADEIALGRKIMAGRAVFEAGHRPGDSRGGTVERQFEEAISARDRLVICNLRFVVFVASKYARKYGYELMDLVQYGTAGLLRAAEKFDFTQGTRFCTYGAYWIEQALKRAISHGRLIRIPVRPLYALMKVKKARRALAAELGHQRTPTVHEIADRLGWAPERVQYVLDADLSVTSLDDSSGTDEGAALARLIPAPASYGPDSAVMRADLSQAIARALATLGERDKLILTMRFGIDGQEESTLAEIGERVGLTPEGVRLRVARALDHLRRSGLLRP